MDEQSLNHEYWHELIAVVALGGGTEEEVATTREHLATCRPCTEIFADYRAVSDRLATLLPPVEPPAHLEARVRGRLQEEAPSAAREAVESPSRLSTGRWRQPAWWVAAAALLLATFLGLQNLRLREEIAREHSHDALLVTLLTSPEMQPILLQPPQAGEAQGRFVWAPGNPVASLVAEDLPPSRPRQRYQLWLVRRDGTIDNGGLFEVGPDGLAYLSVRAVVPWREYTTIEITQEPAGGSRAPTGAPLLAGDF